MMAFIVITELVIITFGVLILALFETYYWLIEDEEKKDK